MESFVLDEEDLKSNVWTCSKYPALNREVLRQDKRRKCDFDTKSAKTFKVHLQRVHQSHEFPKSFLCPVRPCTSQNKVFSSSKDLRQHYACLHAPAELLCPVCGKMLRSPKSFKRHVTDCKTGVFTCSTCSVMYSSRTSLVRHQKVKNHVPEDEPGVDIIQVEVTEPSGEASNGKVVKIKQDYILVPVTKLGTENYAVFHNNKFFQINNPEPVSDHVQTNSDHVHHQDKEVGTSQTYNNQGSQYHIPQSHQASQHHITQSNQGSQYHGPGSHQSASDNQYQGYHGPGSHQSGTEHQHSSLHCHHIATQNHHHQGSQHQSTMNNQGSQYQPTVTLQNNQATQHETPENHRAMHSQGSQHQITQSNQGSQYHGPGSHQSASEIQYQNQQTSLHQGSQVERYNQGSQYQDVNLEHQGVQCDLPQGSFSQWMGPQTSLINPFSTDHNVGSESDEERVLNDQPLFSALDNIHTQTETLWNITEFSTQTVTEQQSFGTQTACDTVLESLECVECDLVEYLDAQTDTAQSGRCFGAQTETPPSPGPPPPTWPHTDQSCGIERSNTECQTLDKRNSTHTQTNMLKERVLQSGMNSETQTVVDLPSFYNESFTQTQESFELTYFPK